QLGSPLYPVNGHRQVSPAGRFVPMAVVAALGCRVNSITSDVRSGFWAQHGSSSVFMQFLYFGCLIHIVFICDLPALLGLERAAS
ncbi:MAG: hypothetical protein WA592_26045, partial [Pseudolabrys sp.]